ncbi:MAG: hypothetical protein EPN70_21840 [Paraburkholderia sp.]|uniref:hypothetical protein n=1 Tax=Paraburkholderia sp. TaxID=1926495 RepID=UPI00121BFF7C|nr:hypothetical protein [Paraburkholderia sp.]TAM00616.1 MAG: hypothetical protein EPN70_21840 [Paraburkholderia sp.]TAM31454.1 MAG: hypothetical protein EPN59_04725 [Paraburkholderia sp.]
MTPAELRAVKEAYAAGYKAAHADIAASPSGGATQAAAGARPARKIVDLKETYSDAGDVETVQQIPVSSAPLPDDQQPAQMAPAPARHAAKVAQAPKSTAASARAPSTDQLVAEFCSATTQARATGNPAPQPARATPVTAREDQVPDDGDQEVQAVTPQQFEADARAYAREMARSEDTQGDASAAAQPEMQTAYTEAPPRPASASAPPRRFWSEQYHTWVTVRNAGQ